MSYYPDPANAASDFSSRVDELEAAIRKHRDQSGDDRCWQDDQELYSVLPEGYTPEGYTPPEMDEPVMLNNCKRYIERRQCPLTKYVPNLVEQAVHDLIARKAVHANKGIAMGEETWKQLFEHMREETNEVRDEVTTVGYLAGLIECHKGATPEEEKALDERLCSLLEELGDLYGIIVHAIVKAGFTVRQVEDRELLKLKERYPE
jgi:hypothetical protein